MTTIAYVGTSQGVTPNSSVPTDRRSSSDPAMPNCADGDEREAAGDDGSCDTCQRRAKRNADADVLRPFGDQISEQTVEPERGQ